MSNPSFRVPTKDAIDFPELASSASRQRPLVFVVPDNGGDAFVVVYNPLVDKALSLGFARPEGYSVRFAGRTTSVYSTSVDRLPEWKEWAVKARRAEWPEHGSVTYTFHTPEI